MPLPISRSLNRLNILSWLSPEEEGQVGGTTLPRLPFIGNRCCPTIKISRYMQTYMTLKAFEAFSPKHSLLTFSAQL